MQERFLSWGFLIAAVAVVVSPAAQGGLLIGSSGSVIYDIDPTTGAATNPRDTGIEDLRGIAYARGGTLYGMDNHGYPFTIDRTTGSPTALGLADDPAPWLGRGIAFDPVSRGLLASIPSPGGVGPSITLRLTDLESRTSDYLGTASSLRLRAPAFDPSGRLFLLDTLYTSSLVQLSMTPSSIGRIDGERTGIAGSCPFEPYCLDALSTIELSENIHPSKLAMAIDLSGHFFVTSDQDDGSNVLFSLDPGSGLLAPIGQTGVPGITSLTAVPEPGTLLLMGVGAAWLIRRRRRAAG